MRGVDDRSSKLVLGVSKRRSNCCEILAAVGRQTSVDVFKHYRSRSAVSLNEAAHQFPERPERSRTGRGIVSFAAKAPIAARKGKVLAGKRSPCEVDQCWGQIRQRQACDIAVPDVARAPVGFVSRNLLLIEVVGEQAAPRVPKPGARHAAAGEKLEKCELRHARDRFSAANFKHRTSVLLISFGD